MRHLVFAVHTHTHTHTHTHVYIRIHIISPIPRRLCLKTQPSPETHARPPQHQTHPRKLPPCKHLLLLLLFQYSLPHPSILLHLPLPPPSTLSGTLLDTNWVPSLVSAEADRCPRSIVSCLCVRVCVRVCVCVCVCVCVMLCYVFMYVYVYIRIAS